MSWCQQKQTDIKCLFCYRKRWQPCKLDSKYLIKVIKTEIGNMGILFEFKEEIILKI